MRINQFVALYKLRRAGLTRDTAGKLPIWMLAAHLANYNKKAKM